MRTNCPLNPSKPLVGTSNSKVVIQLTVFIVINCHFLLATISMTAPDNFSSTLMMTFSIGSVFTQFSSLKITCGAETWISNPSLLIVSMSTDKCSSPLPETAKRFPHLSKFISKPTLVCNSLASLSWMFLEVTSVPSLPAKGESLTRKSMVNVGASTLIGGNGSHPSTPTVSPTKIFGMPAIVTISPQRTCLVSTLESPSVVKILVIFHFLLTQELSKITTSCPCLIVHS